MKYLFLFLLLVGLNTSLVAETIYSSPQDFYLDPPEGWEFLQDPTPELLVLTDPDHEAVLQIFVKESEGRTVEAAGKALMVKLKAQGEDSLFDYNGSPAWIGALEFKAGPGPVTAWALILPWKEKYLTALAFAPKDSYGKYSDSLNSALNSLALGEAGRRIPGPLSRYYELTSPGGKAEMVSLTIGGKKVQLPFPALSDQSAQVLVERESRILMPYASSPLVTSAWPRFYRQIFREIYGSLEPVAAEWEKSVQEGRIKPAELPAQILTWLQGITYARKGGISDLSTPWETFQTWEGDCDSRALIYAGLLIKFGYNAILMVSGAYGHGMAAVDLPGPGARLPFQGKQWLVAELTAPVALGQIAQDMSDPAKWLGVDLLPQP